jgi:hypothetical protein
MSISARIRRGDSTFGEKVDISVFVDGDNVVLRQQHHIGDKEWHPMITEDIALSRGAALGLSSELLKLVNNPVLTAQD